MTELSRRDYFAAKALHGLLINNGDKPGADLVWKAVHLADRIIYELNKGPFTEHSDGFFGGLSEDQREEIDWRRKQIADMEHDAHPENCGGR